MGKAIEKVNPGRKRRRVTKEFKLEAVRLLELGEKPATQLAAELGTRRNQNVFEVLVDAVRCCSLGQITNALFEVGGQYRRSM